MTTPAKTKSAGGAAGDKSPGAWLKSHHVEVYAALAGLALTALLYLRSRSSSTTTGATSTSAPASTVAYLPATTGAGEVGSPSSAWAGGGAPGSLTTTSASSTGAKTTTPGPQATERLTQQAIPAGASGYSASADYGAGVVSGATGSLWGTIATLTDTAQMIAAGDTVGYEPSLGTFVPITSSQQLAQVEGPGKKTTTWAQV